MATEISNGGGKVRVNSSGKVFLEPSAGAGESEASGDFVVEGVLKVGTIQGPFPNEGRIRLPNEATIAFSNNSDTASLRGLRAATDDYLEVGFDSDLEGLRIGFNENTDVAIQGPLAIKESSSEPSAKADHAVLFLDSSGNLKVKFGNGTVKELADDS